MSERVRLELGPRSHDILIGPGLLEAAPRHLGSLLPEAVFHIITDENVGALHGEKLARAVRARQTIAVPAGEAAKSVATLDLVLNRLLEAGLERGHAIIALGGGVVGDLAGFAAAIALRGIALVQAPTTLLAQIDSAIGGKTGINMARGKNLVGAFHQPSLVLADTAVLATLPARELRAGYAEMVKYALIDNPAFFEWLEENGAALLAGDAEAQRHAIAICARSKAAIVARDEFETGGRRALLNLGHTFGHAFEAEAGYGALLHGEAVSIGLRHAFRLSVRLGLCPDADYQRVRAHLARHGLPVDPPPGSDPDKLVQRMMADKKTKDGRPHFVILRGIGRAIQSAAVDVADIRAVLAETIGEHQGAA